MTFFEDEQVVVCFLIANGTDGQASGAAPDLQYLVTAPRSALGEYLAAALLPGGERFRQHVFAWWRRAVFVEPLERLSARGLGHSGSGYKERCSTGSSERGLEHEYCRLAQLPAGSPHVSMY